MKAKEKTILYRQKELLRITLESIGQGIVATNKEGRISLLNKSAQAITGWQKVHRGVCAERRGERRRAPGSYP